MASGTQDLQHSKLAVEARIKTLINNDLKEICRGENLAVSGVKAQLQNRILQRTCNTFVVFTCMRVSVRVQGDANAFERIRYRVNHHGQSPTHDAYTSALPHLDRSTPISPAPGRPMTSSSYGSRPPLPPFSSSRTPHPRLSYRESPFYQIVEAITVPQDLADGLEMPQNRHTVNVTVALSSEICDRLKLDPTSRLMLYCSASSAISNYTPFVDIAFPNQLEIRVNGDEVKSNFKGLKNKPGTTKPADITDYVRKAADYKNMMNVTYALTSKKFSIVVNLVKRTSADTLAEKVKNGRIISKEQVIQEMVEKSKDPDIVTTSAVMSLKDPISTMRITLPCRSISCTHSQCFDGSYFLQLQEQAPTWTCPVCNKTISYQALAVDQYVQDILSHTPSSTEQVIIEPNGAWRPVVQGDDASNGRGKSQARAAYDNDSDDDIIEIQDTNADKVKVELKSATPVVSQLVQQTPPLSSREPSIATSGNVRPANKRSSAAVIDLTLSDDDEPPRPAKRANTNTSQGTSYNTPTSLPENRFTDLGSRRPSFLGNGFHQGRPDTLPPIQLGQPSGGLPDGQRLPWPAGAPAPAWSGAYRDSTGSYSGSP
ncbi:hypothetical protein MBLNU459_g8231t3 [Dothideomycetes sp. NU459]